MIDSPKRILVTGGAGFVGSHLVDRLAAQGHKIIVLDDLSSGSRDNIHADAEFVEGDVCDAKLVGSLVARVDACFHLAAIASVQQCEQSWTRAHAVNQSAFVGLLEQIGKREGGVIPVAYASSAAAYGNTAFVPVHEELPPRPISVYGADKAACELHAHAAGKTKAIPSFGLRPFNIYGPRQNPSSPYSGVISIFADRIKRGQGITIYGDGKQTRDFIHVADIVDFFLAAMDKASVDAPVCNAATGKETSIEDVAHHLAKILGREARITHAEARKGDIYRSVADITRAQNMLGRTANVPIEDGLKFILEQKA